MLYVVNSERHKGKTELAIDIWLADPENTFFIVDKLETLKSLKDRIGDRMPSEFENHIKPYNKHLFIGTFLENKKIVWDEPFWKKDWQKFLKDLVVSHLGISAEIILIGSFKHEIKDRAALAKFKPNYTTIKEFRANSFWYSEVMKKFEEFYNEQSENEEL